MAYEGVKVLGTGEHKLQLFLQNKRNSENFADDKAIKLIEELAKWERNC